MTATISEIANKSFDYVIIGGGTSGLVLAARLSSDPSVSVAVLEAGESHVDDPNILTPYASPFTNPKYDWAFWTTTQQHSNNKKYQWSRGKGLGGSSSFNFHIWKTPTSQEIDAIEKLGNPGWNWNEYSKYFKLCETFHPSASAIVSEYHGTSGPIQNISPPRTVATMDRLFHETLDTMGLKQAKDPYGGDIMGSHTLQSTIDPKTMLRCYAANAYYFPVQNRANLVVLTEAHVARILLDGSAPGDVTATGVEFTHNGETYRVKCNKEVVLSAGAIQDPQILELSGIGCRDVLEKIGVDVKIDLPGVGENAQEHIFFVTVHELSSPASDEMVDLMRDAAYAVQNKRPPNEEAKLQTVALSCWASYPLSFVSSKDEVSRITKAIEDKIETLKASGKLSPGLKEQYEIQLDAFRDPALPDCHMGVYPGYFGDPALAEPGKAYMSIPHYFNRPFSRGSIHAVSRDPSEQPEIDPHYFEIDHDLDSCIHMFSVGRRMSTYEPFKSGIVREVVPGPEVDTDEAIGEYIKNTMGTTFHTIGTCSMLPRDKNGVVGPDLIVHGTKNLRVVDISIVPIHFSVPSQATAYVIGEKAADIIRGG